MRESFRSPTENFLVFGVIFFRNPLPPLSEQGPSEEKIMSGVCGVRDQRLCYEPEPHPDEVKREHKATAGALRRAKVVAKDLAEGVAKDALAEPMSHGIRRMAPQLGKLATGVGVVSTAVNGTELLANILDVSRQEGKEMNRALAAQSRDVCILMVVAQTDPNALTPGYLPHRAQAIGADKFQHPAFKLATEIATGKTADAAQLRAAVVHAFNRGKEVAYDRQINSQEALTQALNHPPFKKDWDGDAAFRQGVLAAIDQATRDPNSYAASVQIAQAKHTLLLPN
jgi:hypothetical protein